MHVNPLVTPARVGDGHLDRLAEQLRKIYKLGTLERNMSLPCGL